jgi:uncharacterized protein HemX
MTLGEVLISSGLIIAAIAVALGTAFNMGVMARRKRHEDEKREEQEEIERLRKERKQRKSRRNDEFDQPQDEEQNTVLQKPRDKKSKRNAKRRDDHAPEVVLDFDPYQGGNNQFEGISTDFAFSS